MSLHELQFRFSSLYTRAITLNVDKYHRVYTLTRGHGVELRTVEKFCGMYGGSVFQRIDQGIRR